MVQCVECSLGLRQIIPTRLEEKPCLRFADARDELSKLGVLIYRLRHRRSLHGVGLVEIE